MSRYDGKFEHVFENSTAGVAIMAPQLGEYDPQARFMRVANQFNLLGVLDINTVAAGGGSILFFRHGLFVVGPESAGAHPGACCNTAKSYCHRR